jgi:peptide/nickel transport system substrate-binding protein
VTFLPIADGDSRINTLLSGQINAAQSAGAGPIETMQNAEASGEISLVESSERAEVGYGMLNASKPPFDDPLAREAAAAAIDREEFNTVVNRDLFTLASGPFAPGELGYLEDSGYPQHDPEKAKQLLAEYEAKTGQPLEFTFTLPNDPASLQLGQLVQEQGKKVGVKVNLQPVEQATLISTAIGGSYQAIAFRNHPGGDPDTQYVWWYGGAPTNFGRFDDPEVNALLDAGRAETDPAKRRAIYEDLNRQFAKQLYNLWLYWIQWDVGTATNVHGILGPDLPDGSEPSTGLAAGHSLAGTWIEQ